MRPLSNPQTFRSGFVKTVSIGLALVMALCVFGFVAGNSATAMPCRCPTCPPGGCGGTCPEGTVSFSASVVAKPTSATLDVTINVDASVTLQWGTSTSYGNSESLGTEPTYFSVTIGSLSPVTTYYYKLSGTASCYNAGSYASSFVTATTTYYVAINVFESGGTVTISGGSGAGTFSSGQTATLQWGITYTLGCNVGSISNWAPEPWVFVGWVTMGVSVGGSLSCSTTLTVGYGGGTGYLTMELGYTSVEPCSGTCYASWAGLIYGSTTSSPGATGQGNDYQVGAAFDIPSSTYDTFGGTYSGPEGIGIWVGIGGVNHWDNEGAYSSGSLWQAGVQIYYASSSQTTPTITPWVEDYPNAIQTQLLPNDLAAGGVVQISVGVQVCNSGPSAQADGYAQFFSPSPKEEWNNLSYDGETSCGSGVGPITQIDTHTAEWIAEVPSGWECPTLSQNIQFQWEDVSSVMPTSLSSFASDPVPSNEFNSGASTIANATAQLIVGAYEQVLAAATLSPSSGGALTIDYVQEES